MHVATLTITRACKLAFAFTVLALALTLMSERAEALAPYQQDAAVSAAFSYEGMPYVAEGGGYYGLDCSDLTSLSLAAAGVTVSDDPVAQYYESYPVYYPAPGDIVFYDSYLDGGIDHVALYVGEGMVMDANAYHGYAIYHAVEDVPGFIGYGRV